ncbi:hypothetical protein GCM10027270_24710 [Nocardioides ginkgobilobae]
MSVLSVLGSRESGEVTARASPEAPGRTPPDRARLAARGDGRRGGPGVARATFDPVWGYDLA